MHDLKRAFGTPDEEFRRRTRQTLRHIESKEASRRPARKSPSLSVALSFALGLALILSSVFALSQRVSTPKTDSTLSLARGSLSGSPLPIEAPATSPTPEPTASLPTPEPTASLPTPEPTASLPTPEPTAEYATPEPTDDYVTSKPNDDYATPYPTASAVPFSLTNEQPVVEGIYYYAPDGIYYHAASDCSGLHAALTASPDKALALGLTACPVCLDKDGLSDAESDESNAVYYYAPDGIYYHAASDCSDLHAALTASPDKALALGLTACPVCLGDHSAEIAYDASDRSLILYASENDSHYHLIPDCPDLADGETLSEDALLLRISCEELTFCPTCQIKWQSAATIGLTDPLSDAPLELYAIENDLYYHLIPGCPEQADGETLSNDALLQRISCEELTFCPICASALTVQPAGEINGAH